MAFWPGIQSTIASKADEPFALRHIHRYMNGNSSTDARQYFRTMPDPLSVTSRTRSSALQRRLALMTQRAVTASECRAAMARLPDAVSETGHLASRS